MTALSPSALALSGSMAVAAGLLGCFALMRRMTLAADALSHVALPGIGLALLLRLHPLAGALGALLGGAIVVWALESRTRLGTEAVIGVVFSAALAVGALLTTGEELMDALFGAPGTLSRWELVTGLAGAAAVIAFVLAARDRLIVSLVSREIAITAGIRVKRLNLYYLLAFAVTIGLGLRYLGVLLMGSLAIIPAAAARRLARNLNEMLLISATVALFSTVTGAWLAERFHRESGPLIVVVAAACFLLTTLRSPRA
jgi:ABC-type Mn2+/Zn2+ transport system permease subunit